MPPSLTFLVATMTGAAEALAEDLQAALGGSRQSTLALLEELSTDDLLDLPLALVVSSTYGVGEVPETAEEIHRALLERRPDLSGLVYGVISLGDRNYGDTFARGGENWIAALSACGAKRVGDMLRLDCQSGEDPLAAAEPWMMGWLRAAEALLEEGCAPAAHRGS